MRSGGIQGFRSGLAQGVQKRIAQEAASVFVAHAMSKIPRIGTSVRGVPGNWHSCGDRYPTSSIPKVA
jgi:hypothetical protein